MEISNEVWKNMVDELAEKAYSNYCQNTGGDTQEIIDAEKEFNRLVGKLNLKQEIELDLSDAVLGINAAYEHKCFLAGYKMAMETAKGR